MGIGDWAQSPFLNDFRIIYLINNSKKYK